MRKIEIPIDVAISIATGKMAAYGSGKDRLMRILQYLVKFANDPEDVKYPEALSIKAKEVITSRFPEMGLIDVNIKEAIQLDPFLIQYIEKYGKTIEVEVDEDKVSS